VRERLFPQKNNRNETTVNIVLAQARDKTRVDAMLSQITEVLRQRHNIQFAGEDDFSVATHRDLLSTVNTITDTLTLFLAAVAGISLFVGGIGIMNIMLVSIQERTREIGLRKAIGAQPVTIMLQFLAEATTLALLGGLIGITIGWGVASAISFFAGFPALVTAPVVAVAIAFSLLVGIAFGVYPAWRAAQLNPVEALRYE
jgi:putative ABC transport system permease protein